MRTYEIRQENTCGFEKKTYFDRARSFEALCERLFPGKEIAVGYNCLVYGINKHGKRRIIATIEDKDAYTDMYGHTDLSIPYSDPFAELKKVYKAHKNGKKVTLAERDGEIFYKIE